MATFFFVKSKNRYLYPIIFSQETEELEQLELLLLLDFLTSEGRQLSEYEQEMAEALCDDLKKAKLDVVSKLMIVLFMNNFDSDDLGYADFVSQDWALFSFYSYRFKPILGPSQFPN